MSADRELLVFAAKAAGAFITKEQFEKECTSPWDQEWEPSYNESTNSISGWRTWYGSSGELGGWERYEWAPLTGDGDALRLAVKLRIHLEFSSRAATPTDRIQASPRGNGHLCATEMFGDDENAAARRAITCAAAEIGKAMP